MHDLIPADIKNIAQTLTNAGFQAFLVGGSVRNMLLKKPVKDWDFTTDATPEQILKLFPDAFYDNQFGTVGVPLHNVILGSETTPESKMDSGQSQNDKIVVEITTFRSESEYKDRRHPQNVVWGKTIEEDLARRDFTINALALRITNSQSRITDIVDPYGGQKDLQERLIKAVGDPNQRFKEDALRLLRAIRFAAQLSFAIEEDTGNAIKEDAMLLEHISGERVRDELLKILASDYPYDGVMMLKNAGLLQYILPELLEGIDISQIRPGRHHTTDVFTHNIMSLKFTPSDDPIVRLAALLHDVGKPRVIGKDANGLVTFYNHEIAGAKIARDIADRLRLSKKQRDKMVTLIRWHMFSVNENITDAGVRRFIRRIGVENVKDMMDLRIGDRLGGGTQTAESWRLKLFKKKVEDQLQPAPFSINDLVIDGTDIMKELNIKPGPKIGQILQQLFEEVDEDLSKNTKEYLLKRMKELQ